MKIEDLGKNLKSDTREIAEIAELVPGPVGIAGKVVSTVIDLSERGRRRKIEVLLSGMCGNSARESEEALNRLYDCLKSEETSEYIVELFQQALLSNSKMAIIIMGFQWNMLEKKKAQLDHKELMVFGALCELNDFDIRNFNYICDSIKNAPFREKYLNMETIPHEKKSSISYSLDKLLRHNLISKDDFYYDGEGTLVAGTFYYLNDLSSYLMELIELAQRLFSYYHLL